MKIKKTTMFLALGQLERDETFVTQRPYRNSLALKYASNFDAFAFGIPAISKRKNGRYFIIDGQHRVGALRHMGWDDTTKIECIVYEGLTIKGEAKMFRLLNDFKQVSPLSKFFVRLTEQDPVALDIQAIVSAAGFRVARTRNAGLTAVSAMEKLYLSQNGRRQGLSLAQALNTIRDSWGDETLAISGQVILGIGLFFSRYGKKVRNDRVTSVLSKIIGGSSGLVIKGKGFRQLHGGPVALNMAHYISVQYNKGLRGRDKLDPWVG